MPKTLTSCRESEGRDRVPRLSTLVWSAIATPWSLVVGHGLGVTGVAIGHAGLALGAGMLAGRFASGGSGELRWALVGAGGAVVKAACGIVVARSEARTSQRATRDLRERVVDGLFAHGASALARTSTLLGAVRAVERAVLAGVLGSVKAGAQLVPLAVTLVVVAPRAALVALVVVAPFVGWVRNARDRARAREHEALDAAAAVDEQVEDVLQHADLLRTLDAKATIASKLAALEARAEAHVLRAAGLRAGLSAANEVLASFAIVAVVLLVSSGAIAMSTAALLPTLSLVFLAYRPMRDLGDARAAVRVGEAALAELAPILADVPPSIALPRAKPASLEVAAFGALRHDRRWSFHVAPGEIVALVGPTGCGKTTLLRALLGLEPASGVVRYGDASIADAPAGDARPFAWVPQEAPLVLGTARENASLGSTADAATELAVLGPTIDTTSDVRARLSGGERALLALARAVASARPVLLLDEPTASLDPEAEARVLARIDALRGSRTVVLVTHRATTAAIADRVL